MPINRLSKQAEHRLTESLEKVASLVSEGSHPNDAIVKVATEAGIPAGHVNLMVNAFNTGRTETQRKIGQDIFEKSAEFDIADAEEVLGRMFPKEIKTAAVIHSETVVSSEYSAPPRWHTARMQKSALNQELPPLATRAGHVVKESPKLDVDPAMAMKRAYCQALDARREIENKRAELSNLQDKLLGSITKLGEYFRQPGCEPFLGVKTNVTRLFGKRAEILLGMLESRNKKLIKQSGSGKELYSLVDFQKEPYKLFKDCIDTADRLVEKKASFEAFEKEANHKVEGHVLPFAQSQALSDRRGVLASSEKTAAIFGDMKSINDAASHPIGNLMGGQAGAGFMSGFDSVIKGEGENVAKSIFKSKDKLKEDANESLEDPVHVNKMKGMQTSAMLTDLMANDEIISSYDPDEVLQHFNEISQIAPRAAGQEGVMRAVLRKRLEGGKSAIDPHDLKTLLEIENQVKERDTDPYKQRRVDVI
jgi:hypothetical protein